MCCGAISVSSRGLLGVPVIAASLGLGTHGTSIAHQRSVDRSVVHVYLWVTHTTGSCGANSTSTISYVGFILALGGTRNSEAH